MSNEYTDLGIDDVEVYDVEVDEQNSTATIYVRETDEYVHELDVVEIDDKKVRHSHLWKCEKTEDGEVDVPLAADEDVEEIVETYPVDFFSDEEEVLTLEVHAAEVESAFETGDQITYNVDGYTIYASQLVDVEDEIQFGVSDDDDEVEYELKQGIEMVDGTRVEIEYVEQDGDDEETTNEVVADGGQPVDEEEDDEEVEFETVDRYDYPEEKPHETFEVVKEAEGGEVTIEIEFSDGSISMRGSGVFEFNDRGVLRHHNGEPVVSTFHEIRHDDDRFKLHVSVPEEIHERLSELEDEHTEWIQNANRWLESVPLIFQVQEHEYTTGWRTKYHHTDVVLKANKSESDMSDEQQWLFQAMKEEFGEADDYPTVGEDLDVEEGDVLTLDDVIEYVSDTLDEIRQQEMEKQEWEDLVTKHPGLRGLKSVTSEEVKEAFKTAKKDREKVEIGSRVEECNQPDYECGIDHVHVYVTPDGDVETNRIHTH